MSLTKKDAKNLGSLQGKVSAAPYPKAQVKVTEAEFKTMRKLAQATRHLMASAEVERFKKMGVIDA